MAEIQQALLEEMAEHAVNDFLRKNAKKLGITRSCITHVELIDVTEAGWYTHKPNSIKVLLDPVWWPSGMQFAMHFVVPRRGREHLYKSWWVSRAIPDLSAFRL